MAKSGRFIVLNKCFHQGELYHPGQIVTLADASKASRHFEPYKPNQDSELDKLREQAYKEGHIVERAWGVDRLKEALGLEPPAHQKWLKGGAKVEKLDDVLKK